MRKTQSPKNYYQPYAYSDDGTNIEFGDIPYELKSFQAFEDIEECKAWLKNNGYDPGDFVIHEYHDDDIEDVIIIDQDGDIVAKRENENSPLIRIPSLDQMYEDVKKVVLEAQGDKAYIDTDPKDCVDTIHTHKYNEVSDIFEEEIVFGVRVKDGDLQIIANPWMRTYHNRPSDEEYLDEDNWHSVKNSDAILYVPTLFNIAENIREYIG